MLGATLGVSLAALALVAEAATVEYSWTVDWVQAAPAGVPRTVIGINGAWPCPLVEAHKGDTIIVHLTNNLGNETTGLHFHGINQVSTNWMDGPNMATQCPIAPGKTMTYAFVVRVPFPSLLEVTTTNSWGFNRLTRLAPIGVSASKPSKPRIMAG